MIDEKALEAAIERYPVALQEACDAGKVASHRMKFAVRAAILAYEAAKAQTLALLVTPDRGRRVEHPMAAKPASEPVAGLIGIRTVTGATYEVGLHFDTLDNSELFLNSIRDLSAPSKDGG